MWIIVEHSEGELTHVFQPSSLKNYELQEGQILIDSVDVWDNQRAYYVSESEDIVYRGLPPTENHRWIDGKWQFRRWLLLERVRAERDRLLAESDWTALPDSPVDWSDYRQALRDLPLTIDKEQSLDEVKWPERPNGK